MGRVGEWASLAWRWSKPLPWGLLMSECRERAFELCVRLRGNFFGRDILCVRSKSPHLLHSNFPGLSTERRHVEVSVALQLKHRRRILLLSFVFASSV